MSKPVSVDAYIAAAPVPVRVMLKTIRSTIKNAAPKAEEKISYSMPYFGYHGRLIYYAAFAKHVSIFPMLSAASRKKYATELKKYLSGKVTMQVPIGAKVPTRLIADLVKARVREVDEAMKKT